MPGSMMPPPAVGAAAGAGRCWRRGDGEESKDAEGARQEKG